MMWRLLLAALALLVLAGPADAYQLFSQTAAVSGVQPEHWAALPINLTLDGGPTDLSTEIASAVGTWNAVPTAKDPFGTVTKAGVDFDETNLGTAWGNLTGDGSQEVVVDETGKAIAALGFAPAAVNGFGPRHELVTGGQARIDDMFLIINASKNDFDRPATEIHELGHTIGIAHSSTGWAAEKDGALSPELISQVPTMHPFSTPGTDRRTLEADDAAALSSLYPGPTFASTDGTIKGTVTRCDGGLPVSGVNVRAVNVNDPSVQLSRVTGFDGGPEGHYEIEGVPPGDYFVIAEPLAGDDEMLDRLAMFTPVETDFTQEYFNATKEADCAQDDDPSARESIAVAGGGTDTADIKVSSTPLALVVDVTRSMGPELGAIKVGLETMITALQATPGDFPQTAIVTFDDNAKVNIVSHDPDKLRDVISGLTTHSTPDCPEGSNSALMAAGRLLGSEGRAVLVTDADSLRHGPSRDAVDALFASKGATITTLLSGSCPPDQNAPLTRHRAALAAVSGDPGGGPDEARPLDELGVENAVRTFSEESLFTGGLFSFQPDIKTGGADVQERYSNTLANAALSAVRPGVAAITPSALPRGTTLDAELTGSGTSFGAGSTVTVAGAGVSASVVGVSSPTRMVVRLTVAPGAALGFRDVTVTTPLGGGTTESASAVGAVEVAAAPVGPEVLSVTPSAVPAGGSRDVRISGALTHFGGGSTASFTDSASGDVIAATGVTAETPTSLVAHVTVPAGAKIGFRDVSVQTGGETAAEDVPGPFLVAPPTPGVPRLLSASPRSAVRGTTVDVTLTGAGTSFADGTSVASVGGTGVSVLSTTVSSPSKAVARLELAPDAPLGFRDIRVTTGAETAALLDGFQVRPQPVVIPTPTPTPPPRPGGGGGPPPPPACGAARATLAKPRVKKRTLRLRGTAACVARVRVAISRPAAHRRCRFVTARGKLGKARRCSKPVLVTARGVASWRLSTKALPAGRYTIRVRPGGATRRVTIRGARRK